MPISKQVFQENKARQNFPKNEPFLPLMRVRVRGYFLSPDTHTDTHTYVCVSGGKKCQFFEKFGVLCFLEIPVLRFALLPYYRLIFNCFVSEIIIPILQNF